jgi:chaperonin GroES
MILARRFNGEKATRSRPSILEVAKEAEVIAVAPGINGETNERVLMNIREGDRILIEKFTETEIEIAEEYLIISEDKVLAVIG